jgi:hypothetical protein
MNGNSIIKRNNKMRFGKSLFIMTFLFYGLLLNLYQPVTAQTSTETPQKACRFEGNWNSTWGGVTFTGKDNAIKAKFNNQKEIEGVASGRMLMGAWTEHPTFRAPDDAGNINLIISEDCQSISGDWRYGFETENNGWYINEWKATKELDEAPIINETPDIIPQKPGKTFNLDLNTSLTFEVPTDWGIKTDENNNVIFNHIKTNDQILIYLFNNVFPYKDDENKTEIIKAHIKGVAKVYKDKMEDGTDFINGYPVKWISFPEDNGNEIVNNKIFYPYNDEMIFMVMTTYSNNIPLEKANNLLNTIFKAITE